MNYPVILSANAAASVDGTVVSYASTCSRGRTGSSSSRFLSRTRVGTAKAGPVHGDSRGGLDTADYGRRAAGGEEGTLLTATASEVQRTTTSEFSAAFRVGPQLPPATVGATSSGAHSTGTPSPRMPWRPRPSPRTGKRCQGKGQGRSPMRRRVAGAQRHHGGPAGDDAGHAGVRVRFRIPQRRAEGTRPRGALSRTRRRCQCRGAGVGGSDRVTLTWTPDSHGWKSDSPAHVEDRTGTARPVLLRGFVGDTPAPTTCALTVSPADFAATRAAVGTTDATVTNRFDHSRDGVVSPADVAIVRFNMAGGTERINPATAAAPRGAEPLLPPPRPMKELTT